MAIASKSIKSNKKKILKKVRDLVFDSQLFPIMLTFATLAILFVLFRMKGVETDYKISSLNKDIERVSHDKKELRAKKARLLGVNKLRKLANKYNLSTPTQDQIIIIK